MTVPLHVVNPIAWH